MTTETQEEIKPTTYEVKGKEYKVGDPVEVTPEITELLAEAYDIGEKLDTLTENIYSVTLFEEDTDAVTSDTLEDVYFLDYTELKQRRTYILNKISRELYRLHGGFVPTQLQFEDGEAKAIIREKMPDESITLTRTQIEDLMNVSDVARPIKDLLTTFSTEGSIVLNYEDCKDAGTLVLRSETNTTNFLPLATTFEGIQQNPVFTQLFEHFKGTTDKTLPPYVIMTTDGATNYTAGYSSNMNISNMMVGQLFTTLLSKYEGNPPVLVANVFMDVIRNENKVELVMNFMFITTGLEEDRTMVNARYDVTPEGLTFKEFWGPKDFAEKTPSVDE